MILPTRQHMRHLAPEVEWHEPNYHDEIWKYDPKIELPWPTTIKREQVQQKIINHGISIVDVRDEHGSLGCHNEIDQLVNAIYEIGLVIRVPSHCVATITLSDICPPAAMTKMVLIIAEGAKIHCIDRRSVHTLQSESIEIRLGKMAQLEYIDHRPSRDANFLIRSFTVIADEYSTMTLYSMQKAAKYSKLFAQAELKGIQSHITMKFGIHALGTHYHSIITQQHHYAPYTRSHCTVKTAQHDAQSMYHGCIAVEKSAIQSQAFQNHKALLLTTGARAYARPTIEVMTNDVQCGHGSAIGMLDEEQVWYLQSRGLSRQTTEQMLIQAFLHEDFTSI